MPRRKQRTPELRQRVLAAALVLLGRDGVRGFTARRVASEASTSTPAVYELFGDKGGLVREMFFEGFRLLAECLRSLPRQGDARAELVDLMLGYRRFILENPVLAQVMFSRPFADFDPSRDESKAGATVKNLIVDRVQGALDAGLLRGDAIDVAHVLVALVQGLGAAEGASRLGTTDASIERRWTLAIDSLLDGLGPSQGLGQS